MTKLMDSLTETEKDVLTELMELLQMTIGVFDSIEDYIAKYPYKETGGITDQELEEIIKNLVEKGCLMNLIGSDMRRIIILPSEAIYREVYQLSSE